MDCSRQIRISVIIPGYDNPKEWWMRCVDSVKNATTDDDEIILVDDGSKDGAKYLDEIPNVKVIHQDNLGPSFARNSGLEIARGKWVAFVDSDDEVLPDVYSLCVSSLDKSLSDIVVFGVETIWPDDGLKKIDVLPERVYGALGVEDIHELAKSNLLHYVWNKVYRREFLKDHGVLFPLDTVMGEDLTFNFQCISAGAKWCVIPCIGYHYYRSRVSLLSRYKPKYVSGLRHTASIWKRYKDETPGAREILGAFEEPSEKQIVVAEWNNIWLPGSSYSLLERWWWLCARPEVGGVLTFLKKILYTVIRRNLYVRPLRRWHIKRMYPYAVPVEGSKND